MESSTRRRKMKETRSSVASHTIATLAALSVLTVAISAHQQHPQPVTNVTELNSSSSYVVSDSRRVTNVTELNSSSSYVVSDSRRLEPRRKPANVDHANRMNAVPPMLTKTNVINSIQKKQAPHAIQKKQSPYYPSIETGTCLNDNGYPDYYLYDVKSYFFQSPRECCERHFGNSVDAKGGGMLKDGGVGKCLTAVAGDKIVNSSLDQQQHPGMATAGVGHHSMFNAAKTEKMPIPGSSDAIASSIDAGKSDKLSSDASMEVGKADKPDHPSKMFPKPPMPHWGSSTGTIKGDKMAEEKESNPAGKMPPKVYPKPPYVSTGIGKSGKSEAMPGSSMWGPESKISKPPVMNDMPDSSYWGLDSKTSKPSDMEMVPPGPSDLPTGLPPKRPPPPELNGSQGWNPGWNQPPPHSEMHPYPKSSKAKSHKSAKAKSAKSKAGKAKASAPWWGDDDYTYSPTYMPTESDDAWQMGWMGGGGSNSQNQHNGRPDGKPMAKPDMRPPGGKPVNEKPNNGWWGSQMPEKQQRPMQRPGEEPGYMKPNNGWWGGQVPEKPQRPTQGPDWAGGMADISGGKPTNVKPNNGWWGSQMPEKPKPDWSGGHKPDTGSHPGWSGSAWGNSWGSSVPNWGTGWGGDSWGSGWWGGWGDGYKPPIPSMPSPKPNSSTPTAKPTGLFPTETLGPSQSPFRMPTYSPSNSPPTYSPTPAGGTYSPTPSADTYDPTPFSSTYAPSPTSSGSTPNGGFPTLNPTLGPTDDGEVKTPSPGSQGMPTFSPTAMPTPEGDNTPRPTPEPLELCVWGSAYSSGQVDEGEVISVPFSTGVTGVDASAGSKYSLLVTASGVVMASGQVDLDNYHGHLGIQTDDLLQGTNEFQEISHVFDESEGKETDPPMFEKVFAGVENAPGSGIIHSVFLDTEGRAWASGSNSKGQLCLGDSSDRLIPTMISLEGVHIVDVAIGGEHTLLLDKDGNVFGCGSNEMGQLGLSSSTITTDIPLKLYTLPLVSSVSSGRDHSLFIANDGIYVTGDNSFGQLCVDTKGEPLFEPQALDIPFDIITAFQAIFSSSYILFSDGSVIGCGNNNVGQLGNGEEKELVTFEPTVVETEGLVIGLLGTGSSAKSVFFITDEEVYGTGANSNGQLGVGDTDDRNVPTLVGFGSEVEIGLLSAGEDHTLALCPPVLEGFPTFSPSEVHGTILPTFLTTENATEPTLSPTFLTTENGTIPTLSPTFLTTDNGTLPTASPSLLTTENVTATYAPTPAATSGAPSTYSPTLQGFNFFFWGNPESIGQESDENVTQPLTIDGDVSYASAGSKYSVIVMMDGSALTSGVIGSLDEYRGHLGIETDMLVTGVNAFQTISNISDTNGTILDAPEFDQAFAGVENEISSGIIHTILLDRQGNAYATGSNSQGQLCIGDKEDRFIPAQIPIEGPIVDVAIGGEHTLLLHENGTVYVCGSNEAGQIGLGEDVSQTSSPVMLDVISTISSVSAGVAHSLMIAEDGVYVTGDNSYGQLCFNSTEFLSSPMMIDIPIKNIVSFEAIKYSSYILYIDGSVNACGRNDYGQLGDGTNDDKILTEVVIDKAVRSMFTGPSAESIFFLTEDETMFGTGYNFWGNLGVGDQENRALPARVQFSEQVLTSALSPSQDHTIAFGLVTGSLPPSASPTPAPTIPITYSPTRESLNFFFWGAPGSLGQTSSEDITKPLYVEENSVQASAGSKYTLIVLQDGSVLAGGYVDSKDQYQGHLGLGGIVKGENDFKPISNVYDVDGAILDAPEFDQAFAGVENEISSGIIHTILLDRQGNAYATGSNSQGQLCIGDKEDRFIPAQIPIEGPIVDVAIGGEHTLLLHENGTVYVCGSNEAGQIGLGEDVSQTSSPVMLDVISTISSVSAGVAHSLMIAEDGVYVTGDNSYGQLCIDTDNAVMEPEILDTTVDKVSAFEAIRSSSFLLHSDGVVEACGRNDYGQLGDGTNETVTITTVALDDVVRLIGAGPSAESIFFVTNDELVYGTGLNSRGNLGVGDQENRVIPDRVKFPNEVLLSSLSAGDDHTAALGVITGTVIPTTAPTIGSTTTTPSATPTISPSKLTESPSEAPSATSTDAPSIGSATGLPTFSPSSGEGESAAPTSPTASSTTPPASSTETTDLFAWGARGSVGLPTGEVTIPESLDKPVIAVSAGSKYSLILLNDGTAQAAGYIDSTDDYHGHLGLKGSDIKEGENEFQDISSSFDNDEIISSPSFTRVFAGVEQEDAPGSIHSFLIDGDGQAWAMGSNANGELCLGDDVDRLIPTKVAIDGNVVSVAIGAKHTLLLLDDGTVYACGSNEDGQLALAESTTALINTPTKVEGIQEAVMISAGLSSSLFLTTNGMYVSGGNFYGQLCVDTNKGSLFEPTLLKGVNAGDVAAFEAIRSSSYILFKDGSVGACGQNNFGQLADGSNEDKVRVVVKPIPDDIPIQRLGVGSSASSVFFINEDGLIYATGLNDRGQLGLGDTDNRNTLTLVEYSGDFVNNQQISASGDHTLAR